MHCKTTINEKNRRLRRSGWHCHFLLVAVLCSLGASNSPDPDSLQTTAYARALTNRPSIRARRSLPPTPASNTAKQLIIAGALLIAGALALHKVGTRSSALLSRSSEVPT